MNEQLSKPTLLIEASDYGRLRSQYDEESLRQSFCGRFADRESFGQELLAQGTAPVRIAELPVWLRPYVRLDGAAYVAELERAGVYVIEEVRNGICVFEGGVQRK